MVHVGRAVRGSTGCGRVGRHPAVDFFERRGIEFVVAVNVFDDAFDYTPDEIRAALDLKPRVPVELCDARDPKSAVGILVSLVRHLLTLAPAPPAG